MFVRREKNDEQKRLKTREEIVKLGKKLDASSSASLSSRLTPDENEMQENKQGRRERHKTRSHSLSHSHGQR